MNKNSTTGQSGKRVPLTSFLILSQKGLCAKPPFGSSSHHFNFLCNYQDITASFAVYSSREPDFT